MEPSDLFAANYMLDQLYLSMYTTSFIIFLYVCRGLAKKAENIAGWLGLFAIGILVAGYGLGLGAYAIALLWAAGGAHAMPITYLPYLLVAVNGYALCPIIRFVAVTMREEIPKNTKSRAQSLR